MADKYAITATESATAIAFRADRSNGDGSIGLFVTDKAEVIAVLSATIRGYNDRIVWFSLAEARAILAGLSMVLDDE